MRALGCGAWVSHVDGLSWWVRIHSCCVDEEASDVLALGRTSRCLLRHSAVWADAGSGRNKELLPSDSSAHTKKWWHAWSQAAYRGSRDRRSVRRKREELRNRAEQPPAGEGGVGGGDITLDAATGLRMTGGDDIDDLDVSGMMGGCSAGRMTSTIKRGRCAPSRLQSSKLNPTLLPSSNMEPRLCPFNACRSWNMWTRGWD